MLTTNAVHHNKAHEFGYMSFNSRIFLGALIGLLLGWLFASAGAAAWATTGLYLCGLVSGVFIDLLKMVLVPLIFTSIAVGVANLRAHQRMRRVWVSMLLWSALTTTLSIIIGLKAAHVFHPGLGLQLAAFKAETSGFQTQSLTLGPKNGSSSRDRWASAYGRLAS